MCSVHGALSRPSGNKINKCTRELDGILNAHTRKKKNTQLSDGATIAPVFSGSGSDTENAT